MNLGRSVEMIKQIKPEELKEAINAFSKSP